MPAKAWLDEGAELSAGTDYPIGFYEPLRDRLRHGDAADGIDQAAGISIRDRSWDRATAVDRCRRAVVGEHDRLGSGVRDRGTRARLICCKLRSTTAGSPIES